MPVRGAGHDIRYVIVSTLFNHLQMTWELPFLAPFCSLSPLVFNICAN